jgi:hypothetical protein
MCARGRIHKAIANGVSRPLDFQEGKEIMIRQQANLGEMHPLFKQCNHERNSASVAF